MIAKATLKHLRISPRKVRPVIDLIRGKDVQSSLATLAYTNKRSALPLTKLLNSAVSNAKEKGLTEDQLYVSKVTADQGATMKRFRSAPFGRAVQILKKSTHITIELDLKTK